VLPVRIGIRQDAHLVITQFGKVADARIDAQRHADVVHFLRGADLTRLELPGVQDLAAQRHDGLELPVARLLGRAARRITLDQEQFRACRVLQLQSASFPGSAARSRRACAPRARRP